MAQVSMTVRMDNSIKQQFDTLCKQLGMSANTAINIFVNQVIRKKGIPFEITTDSKDIRQQGIEAFRSIRKAAETGELPNLTLEEINEEIKLARAGK